MRKTLKITSIALALVLALGMFAMAFAADSATTVSFNAVSNGEIVTVKKGATTQTLNDATLFKMYGETVKKDKDTGKVTGTTPNYQIVEGPFDLSCDDAKSASVKFTGTLPNEKDWSLVVLHYVKGEWKEEGRSAATKEVKVNGSKLIDGVNAEVTVNTTFSPFALVAVKGGAAAAPTTAAPQTGDSSVMLWGALMMVAAAAAVSTVVISKKHKNEA